MLSGTWLLIAAIERGSWLLWVSYGATMALSLYAHFFVVFVIAAHAVGLIWWRDSINRRAALVAAVIILIAAAPIGYVVVTQGGSTLNWIGPTTFADIIQVLSALAGSAFLLGIYAVGIALGVAFFLRRAAPVGPYGSWVARLVLIAALVPVIGIVGLSLVRPILVERYFIVALPFLIMTVVAATAQASRRVAAAVLAVILAVSSLTLVTRCGPRRPSRLSG